jgi:hypothetical protein
LPIEFESSLIQGGRVDRVIQGSAADFFHLSHLTDTDISVKGILGTGYITVAPAIETRFPGDKYIIVTGSPVSPEGSQDNDIIEWSGSSWRIYLDVSNTRSNFAMVYDRTTKRVYQYDSTEGWRTLIVSKSTIDGGTFP